MYTVLLAEDLSILRRQMRRLSLWGDVSGFSLDREAEDGKEALEMLQEKETDLLITDIKMPRMTGLELLGRAVREHRARCVVLLTEFQEFSYAKEAIQKGAFDYLVKPVSRDELSRLLVRVKSELEREEEKERALKALKTQGEALGELFYPEELEAQIACALLYGDEELIELALQLCGDTKIALGGKEKLIDLLLHKAFLRILHIFEQEHPWLYRFVKRDAVLASHPREEREDGKAEALFIAGVEKID